MADYIQVYIDRNEFGRLRELGIPYTGFVIGEGYAFVMFKSYSELPDKTIVDSSTPNIPITEFYIPQLMQIQCINTSEEAMKKSLKGLFSKDGCAIYIVCEGDSLKQIAGWFDVNLKDLMRWNRLSTESIAIGQKILILDITQRKLIDVPNQVNRGEIKEVDLLSKYEFWLDSPSSSLVEGVWKIANNIGYGVVNSPVVWLAGRSIGGASKNPRERADAFIDCAPGLFLDGIKALGVCGKVASGLNGYNAFRKTKQYQLDKDLGKGWQREAGKKFQRAKGHFRMYNDADRYMKNLGVEFSTWQEFSRERDE